MEKPMHPNRLLTWLNSHRLLITAAFLFAAIFGVFFPPIFSAIDEHEYAKNAILLSKNQLTTANPVDYCGGILQNGKYVSSYFLGRSFFMLPFLPFGLDGLMMSGLVMHLLNFVLFVLILQRLKIDNRFSLLYLLFPAFVWSARTLYPELLVLTGIFVATFFYLGNQKREWLLSGIFFGLAVIVRYDAALLAVGFLVVSLFSNRQRFGWLLAGFSAMGLVILLLNAFLYGGPLTSPYGSSVADVVARESNPFFWFNLLLLAAILLIAYPLMLATPLLGRRKLALEAFIGAALLAILFAQKSNISVFEFFSPLTFTGRMRYLIPAAGLLMIPYCIFLQTLLEKLHRRFSVISLKNFFALFAVLLFTAALVLSAVHSDFLQNRYSVEKQLAQHIPEGSLVMGSSDDCIYFLKEFFGNRQYIKVNATGMDVSKILDESQQPVFVMQLHYSNKSDSPLRQQVIDNERNQMDFFVEKNQEHLVPVFSTKSPHSLTIFKFVR